MVVAKTPPPRETPVEEEAAQIRAAQILAALAVGAIAPPSQPPEGVVEAAGTAPQIRAALVTALVVATRAEEGLLTRAPRAAPTTRLATPPTIRSPAPWTPAPWTPAPWTRPAL